VIKIEVPGKGDVTRSWKLPSEDSNDDVSAYFSSVNYRKEYLKLNLKISADYKRFINELKDTDIIISNFKKGDTEKLKIDDAFLRSLNPNLIIGKISGFGADSDRIAYDLILQAETGFMSINGEDNQAPLKMPVALIDVLAAHHLKEGILLALLSKEPKTVHVSLYDAAVASLMNQASNYLMTGNIPKRLGNLHPNIAPYGELFKTKDGKIVTFAIGSNRHFKLLCELLQLHDLENSEAYKTNQFRVKNRTRLAKLIASALLNLDLQTLLNSCLTKGIPCAEIKTIDKVLQNKLTQGLIKEEQIEGKKTSRITSIAAKWTN
jgi:crotonobetainyl-CoA:carnitine CoA-transferase CaiB-like acyl-CoA transferase